MILSGRNQTGLSEREIDYCIKAWDVICGEKKREMVILEASRHSSRTRFNEVDNRIYLGADVKPGAGIEANSRMSVLACLAHELAHAERFELGFQRTITFPDNLVDEAETSLYASFHPILNPKDREDLIEDARDRLNQWFAESHTEVNI